MTPAPDGNPSEAPLLVCNAGAKRYPCQVAWILFAALLFGAVGLVGLVGTISRGGAIEAACFSALFFATGIGSAIIAGKMLYVGSAMRIELYADRIEEYSLSRSPSCYWFKDFTTIWFDESDHLIVLNNRGAWAGAIGIIHFADDDETRAFVTAASAALAAFKQQQASAKP